MGQNTIVPGWERRLSDYVEHHRHTPFAWGRHDCGKWVLGVVEAMFGKPPIWAAEWGDEQEAQRVISHFGNLRFGLSRFAQLNSWSRVDRARTMTKRGDIALVVDDDKQACLGVCVGPTIACPGTNGLEFFPICKIIESYTFS